MRAIHYVSSWCFSAKLTVTCTNVDTRDERDKFIEDANRLATDISGNQTFYTVKPLLNFWAAFTPSAEVK